MLCSQPFWKVSKKQPGFSWQAICGLWLQAELACLERTGMSCTCSQMWTALKACSSHRGEFDALQEMSQTVLLTGTNGFFWSCALHIELLFGLDLGRNRCFWKNTSLAIFQDLILNELLYNFCNQLLHLWRAGETNFCEDVWAER